MILIENAQIMGLEPTIRGMRNPMNSWAKSDSGPCLTHGPAHCKDCPYTEESCHVTEADLENNFIVGPNDLDLMLRLARAGSVDGKFRSTGGRSSTPIRLVRSPTPAPPCTRSTPKSSHWRTSAMSI